MQRHGTPFKALFDEASGRGIMRAVDFDKSISMTQLTDELAHASPLAARLPAVITALALGAVIVYGALFAQLPQLHNAAHDGRHVFSAPCH